ncbi:MAG: hypothetical protein IAG13_25740 [Deltaproteobacteria bacterium]|nr:hypothetical protein [Nannocystaceae bacterium]
MTRATHRLLRSVLPGEDLAGVTLGASLRIEGVAMPARIGGTSQRLVQVRVDASPVAVATHAMLCLELDEGAVRVDVPVEVIASGHASMVLRMIGAPLVLRRRMVRDRALAEALGTPAGALPLVA